MNASPTALAVARMHASRAYTYPANEPVLPIEAAAQIIDLAVQCERERCVKLAEHVARANVLPVLDDLVLALKGELL